MSCSSTSDSTSEKTSQQEKSTREMFTETGISGSPCRLRSAIIVTTCLMTQRSSTHIRRESSRGSTNEEGCRRPLVGSSQRANASMPQTSPETEPMIGW